MGVKKNPFNNTFVNPSFGVNNKRPKIFDVKKNYLTVSNIKQDLYDLTILQPAKNNLDYRIWIPCAWNGSTSDLSNNIWTRTDIFGFENVNFPFKALIPCVYIPASVTTGSFGAQGAYNGSRYPATTRINASTGAPHTGPGLPGPIAETNYSPANATTGTASKFSYSSWQEFKRQLNLHPMGRKVVLGYYFMSTLNPFAPSYVNFYKNTNDGTEYPASSGNKFLTMWHDQELTDTQSSYRKFLDFCITENIKFNYYMDNREHEPFFFLQGYNSTNHYAKETIVSYPDGSTSTFLTNDPMAVTNTSCSYAVTDGGVCVSGGGKTALKLFPFSDTQNRSKGTILADARMFSAIIADPRFTTKVNPKTGKTFSQEFMFHFERLWKNHWFFKNITYPNPTWQDLLSPWMGETQQNGFDGKIGGDWWSFYGCVAQDRLFTQGASCINNTKCGPLAKVLSGGTGDGAKTDIPQTYKSYANLNSYALFHFVCPAWEATQENWAFSHYIREQIIGTQNEDAYKSTFGSVELIQYQKHPCSVEDACFYQTSNLNPYYKNPIVDSIVGGAYYGMGSGNVLQPVSLIPYINSQNSVTLHKTNSSWLSDYLSISGYVKNPQDDNERFNWVGYGDIPSGTKSCDGGLIRYPTISMVDTSNNLLPNNFYPYVTQFAFKVLVDSIKKTRLVIRDNWNYKKYFSPWITDPSWGSENPESYSFRSYYNFSFGYWIEEMFHVLLHSPVFLTYWTHMYKTSFGGAPAVQFMADEWRNISKNLPITPCSNSTGNFSEKVDKLLLTDAFEKYLISGAHVDDSETYIWRLSVPPKHFGSSGIATLQLSSNHPDLPSSFTLNSNDDRTVRSADVIANNIEWKNLNIHNSRGIWLVTKYAGVPVYDILTPKSTTSPESFPPPTDPPSSSNEHDDGFLKIFSYWLSE